MIVSFRPLEKTYYLQNKQSESLFVKAKVNLKKYKPPEMIPRAYNKLPLFELIISGQPFQSLSARF